MGRRPFGSPFNFSYFPLISASIPFANLFMVWFCIQWLFCGNFNQKSASGKFSLLQPNALSHILLQESKRSFSPVFWKNPLQVLVNHPTNNHLRIRWSVIRSLHWCWMTSSRLTDLSPAENQNFEKWKNHKEKNDFKKTIGKMQIDVTNHYRFGTRIRNRLIKKPTGKFLKRGDF